MLHQVIQCSLGTYIEQMVRIRPGGQDTAECGTFYTDRLCESHKGFQQTQKSQEMGRLEVIGFAEIDRRLGIGFDIVGFVDW